MMGVKTPVNFQFQFLIGRLGTGSSRRSYYFLGRFQFLIGRLGTLTLNCNELVDVMFQFLIGRLGTGDFTLALGE